MELFARIKGVASSSMETHIDALLREVGLFDARSTIGKARRSHG